MISKKESFINYIKEGITAAKNVCHLFRSKNFVGVILITFY